MIERVVFKTALWLGSLFVVTFTERKCWAWYVRRLDEASTNDEVDDLNRWVLGHCPRNAKIASWIAYFAWRDTLAFFLGLVMLGGVLVWILYRIWMMVV